MSGDAPVPGRGQRPTGPSATVPAFLAGWGLVGTLSAAIILVAISIAYHYRFDVDGVRLVMRTTARISLLLFSLAFTAPALYRLWPNAWTHWQRSNRRYLGVSFAVSHGVHAIAVISFAQLDPKQFHEMIGITAYLIEGPTYVFIIAMTATSFDRAAAWIGPRAWRVLHTVGAYYIWLNFMYVVGNAAIYSSFYRPLAAFVVFILLVRFVRVPAGAQASFAK